MKKYYILTALLVTTLMGVQNSYSFSQSDTASVKRNEIWERIAKKPYAVLPDVTKTMSITAAIHSMTSLATTFDRESDIMPTGRTKFIHPYGATAPIRWVPVKSRYTGIFATGALGLARLSIAGNPNDIGFVPGMAIKLFVDGTSSKNIQVMYSLDGQGKNVNFFANEFSNKIESPKSLLLKPLAFLFSLVQNPPTYLPVNHFASVTSKGKVVGQPKAPYQLLFAPGEDVQGLIPKNSKIDFRESLMAISAGTTIYDVYAVESENSPETEFIGSVVTLDKFVASEFQDQKLFFQHHH